MFSKEEIKALAEADRLMDSGTIPFVVNRGSRWMVTSDALQEFGLVSGQTVADAVITAILQFQVANLEQKRDAEFFNNDVIEN